jgi:hypothetical protein
MGSTKAVPEHLRWACKNELSMHQGIASLGSLNVIKIHIKYILLYTEVQIGRWSQDAYCIFSTYFPLAYDGLMIQQNLNR